MEERKQVVIKQLLTSRASSTVKRYTLEIRSSFVSVRDSVLKYNYLLIAMGIYLSQCLMLSKVKIPVRLSL